GQTRCAASRSKRKSRVCRARSASRACAALAQTSIGTAAGAPKPPSAPDLRACAWRIVDRERADLRGDAALDFPSCARQSRTHRDLLQAEVTHLKTRPTIHLKTRPTIHRMRATTVSSFLIAANLILDRCK